MLTLNLNIINIQLRTARTRQQATQCATIERAVGPHRSTLKWTGNMAVRRKNLWTHRLSNDTRHGTRGGACSPKTLGRHTCRACGRRGPPCGAAPAALGAAGAAATAATAPQMVDVKIPARYARQEGDLVLRRVHARDSKR